MSLGLDWFFCNCLLEEVFLCYWSYACSSIRQVCCCADSLPGTSVFSWLFVVTATDVRGRSDVTRQNTWGTWWGRGSGSACYTPRICVATERLFFWSLRTWQRFFKQICHIVALSLFQAVTCIKHVAAAGKQTHLQQWQQRLISGKLSQPGLQFDGNNSVWVVFHQNLYFLCVLCLQRLHEGTSRGWSV